ncbi:hypothetical protein ABFS83_14G120900 [Erythranthe nasuta]
MAIQAQFYSENFDGIALGTANQDCVMENLCFAPPRQQQQQYTTSFDQYQNISHQKNTTSFDQYQNISHQKNFNFLASNANSNNIPLHLQRFSAQIDKQRLEFDQLFNLQNERLRLAMQEQRNQQTAILMKKYETKTRLLLKQKDQEIANAANRTNELQNFLNRIEIENQTWQRVARENESMVASLSGTIQRLRESSAAAAACSPAADAESCCENGGEDDEEEKWGERKLVCRRCKSEKSSVILLPCRHLCCCKECEVFLDSCPVCTMVKKASVEALI